MNKFNHNVSDEASRDNSSAFNILGSITFCDNLTDWDCDAVGDIFMYLPTCYGEII